MAKYYWLRLQKDFFKRHDIRIIESMPNGKDYILFYLKLLVESVSHEGELRFSDTIPYSYEMLSTVTDTNVDIVKNAVELFKELNMLEVLEDSTIFMTEVNKMIGSSTGDEHTNASARERMRKYRERKKLEADSTALQLRNGNVTSYGELEIEKEIELDIDKESSTKRKRFVKPTLEDVKAYISEKGYSVDAENWFNYYEANGWKVGKNPMKNWQACIAQWNAREGGKKADKPSNPNIHNFNERKYDMDELMRGLI